MNVKVIPQLFLAIPRSPFLWKGRMHPFVHLFIAFWLYTALQYRSCMSLNFFVFHTATFLFLIFLSGKSSSSCVTYPSLMSSWLLNIFVIGSSITFGDFLSKFSKCCFHRCIHSSWLADFSLVLAVLFLLLTFTILTCLSSTEPLILLIWFYVFSLLF